MGGGMQTSTTTVDNLAPWSGPGIYADFEDTTPLFYVAPKRYAHDYLQMAYLESLAPWGSIRSNKDAATQIYDSDYVTYDQFGIQVPHPFKVFRGWDKNPQGITYAPMDAAEIEAIGKLSVRGTTGDDLIANAKLLCEAIIKGDYLPGTDAAFQQLLTNIAALLPADGTTGIFEAGKMPASICRSLYYSHAPGTVDNTTEFYKGMAARHLGRLNALIKAKNFDMQRNMQHQVVTHAIDFGKQEVLDAETARKASLYWREWRQGDLENRYKMWHDDYTGWIRRLEISGNAIRSLVGTHETRTTRSYKPSPAIGIIGGIATAAVGVATGNPMAMVSGVMGAIGSATQ